MFIAILKDVTQVVALVCIISTFIVSKSSVTDDLRIWQIAIRIIGIFLALSAGISLFLFILTLVLSPPYITLTAILALLIFGHIFAWVLFHAALDGRLIGMPALLLVVYWIALVSYPVAGLAHNSIKWAEMLASA